MFGEFHACTQPAARWIHADGSTCRSKGFRVSISFSEARRFFLRPFESRLHGEDVGCPETGIVSVEQKASHSLRLPAEMTRLER